MKAIEVKEGTWHHWLAKTFGWKALIQQEVWELAPGGKRWLRSYTWVPNDFCAYVRHVLVGLFIMSAISLAIAGMLFCIGVYLVYVYHWLYDHNTFMSKAANIGAGVLGVAIVVVVVTSAMHIADKFDLSERWDAWRSEYYSQRKQKKAAKGDSFLKHAYITLKDRVCFKIKVVK